MRQFPDYRKFVDEAASFQSLNDDERDSLFKVVSVFREQPDNIVDPALKNALNVVETSARENLDDVSGLALLRTVNNVVRAVARFVNLHFVAVLKKAGTTFDSVAGNSIGTVLVGVILGAPVLGILLLLQTAFPGEFAFISGLVRLAKLLL